MARRSPLSPLSKFQSLMARAVMRPLTRSEETRKTWIDGSDTATVAATFIKPNDRLTSLDRLQIYNQQYWWRLHGALAEDFPGLRSVLGKRRFEKVAEAYLDHCGSRCWTLRNLGCELQNFLREHPELTAPRTELALDMAAVEWARVVAFDGPAVSPIRVAEIANLSPALLRVNVQPYLTLLAVHHPIDELLGKLRRRSVNESGASSNAVSAARPRSSRPLTVCSSVQPIFLVVHRVDFCVYYKRLTAPAYLLLTALRAGSTLESACEKAFSKCALPPENSAAQLQEWFADWMRFGWFTKPGRQTI